MKTIIAVLGLAVVVTGGLFAQSASRASSLEREHADLVARVSALQSERNELKERLRHATPIRINEEFMVSARTIHTYRFTPSSVPGTLTGSWRSSGQGSGGVNDTINQFRLTDPKDTILESSG